MLVQILEEVFKDNQFETTTIKLKDDYQTFFAKPSIGTVKQEYFLVLECNTLSDENLQLLIETEAEQFFELIKKEIDVNETFEKNCTMIISTCSDKVSTRSLLLIEEDSYNFKKNVILYTSNEIQSWNETVCDPLDVIKLNELINSSDGQLFRDFKEGKIYDNYFTLLVKIFIKLPFVYYKPMGDKTLYDISEETRKKLTSEKLQTYNYLTLLDLSLPLEELEEKFLEEWED